MSFCEVFCCRSTQDPNRTYHKFPNDPARCKEWLKIVGKKSTDMKVRSAVCSRHFRSKDYYSGGKRLLPSAVPVLRLSNKPVVKVKQSEPNKQTNSGGKSLLSRTFTVLHLSNSPKNEKQLSRARQSESKRPINGSRLSPKSLKRLRNSVPNAIKNRNSLKKVIQSSEVIKKHSKLNIYLDASRNKSLLGTIPNPKNPKHEKDNNHEKQGNRDLLQTDSDKDNVRIDLKHNKTPFKPESKLSERIPLGVQKRPISKSGHRQHSKNNIVKSPSKIKDERKHIAIFVNNKQSSIPKDKQCPPALKSQSVNPLNSKLEENKDVKSNNAIGSDEIMTSHSPSGNGIKTSKNRLGEVSTSDEGNIVIDGLEPRHKRSVKKRKRLVSEDESECEEISRSKPKVQKSKSYFSFCKRDLKQTQITTSNIGSKNLSGIEKTILEMQNKIQMLEKKAIMDERRIETFKKALITQRKTDLQILMDEKENELLLRMDLLYLHYDPHRICRLCLQLVDRKENLTPLFWPMKNQVLLSLIKQATNVEVELEDGMPTGICEECLEDVRRVDWLKRRTQKSNTLIKKFVNLKKTSSQNNLETSQGASDVKQKSDEMPIEEEITDEFKIEDVFSLENSPITFENIQVKQEIESDDDSKLNNELSSTYSVFVKPKVPKKCKNCSKTFRNPWIQMVHFRYCSKRFQCSECNKYFLNAALFRKHKQTLRSCFCAENLRYCYDCNLSFRWKWQLVFHVLRHSTQICELCNDLIHSKEHLQQHVQNHLKLIYTSD